MSQEVSQFILIAEDDSDDRLLYEVALQQSNHQIKYVFVGSGEEVLDYLRNEANPRPFLIIMDFKMPGMSCSEVITAIEENPQLNTIPLVFVSGAVACGEAKIRLRPIFTKPVTIQEWVDTLNQIFTYGSENLKLPPFTGSHLSPLIHHHSL